MKHLLRLLLLLVLLLFLLLVLLFLLLFLFLVLLDQFYIAKLRGLDHLSSTASHQQIHLYLDRRFSRQHRP